MTANAMKGDRERCLEAGMDGYVAKPIRAADLFAAIDKVLGLQRRNAAVNEQQVERHQGEQEPVDLQHRGRAE